MESKIASKMDLIASLIPNGKFHVRKAILPQDAELFFQWIRDAANREVPRSLSAETAGHIKELRRSGTGDCYICNLAGTDILIAEIYNTTFPGLFPLGISYQTTDVWLSCYYNPQSMDEDCLAVLQGLVEALHLSGCPTIWCEPVAETKDMAIALQAGFAPIDQDHTILFHKMF